MDLWIRSQDKTDLICTKRIYVVNNQIRTNVYEAIGFAILGEYATKERALEILDEINTIKYYKYMASLDWETFASSVLKPKPMEEQNLLLAMMNTYQIPEE